MVVLLFTMRSEGTAVLAFKAAAAVAVFLVLSVSHFTPELIGAE